MQHESILEVVQRRADVCENAVALCAPERSEISYRELASQVTEIVEVLASFGIQRQDRVAIVLPNGADMATAFLAVSSAAVSAPLNPDYRAPEFRFFLTDLDARALVVAEGQNSPAVDVARELGLAVIRLKSSDRAGIFSLRLESEIAAAGTDTRGVDSNSDVALVLHTSGTTSRPKLVPLTQENMVASAANVATTLALNPRDRCLNVMPLFHIHGLMAAVLASISAGASIVCCPGFLAPKFFAWLDCFKPTWYTAVPTMHQSILLRAKDNQDIVARSELRFVRSSSAALPPTVLTQLEQTFRSPVIEAYGMTEAAHQMASNPLPPATRKVGTVGVAAGPEVAIMNESGELLDSDSVGEIVIRGRNVSPGYERNPDANASAFVNGWFRTGDQGFVDADGYVTITGRLKEIINRGGEKVSPREIDEVLMTHPAVLQAVAFAIPDPRLGEDIGAAIVLHSDHRVSEQELGRFAAQKLTDYKVPRTIVIVEKIPKGPTGKLQRIGLAEKLGVEAETADAQALDWTPPSTSSERMLSDIWAEVLDLNPREGLPSLGVHSRFLDLGGDSVLATQIATRINESMEIDFPLRTLFETPTVASLAKALDTLLWMRSADSEQLDFAGEKIDI